MTVIVWDGTTLAADKQATMSHTKQAVTKIFRVGNSIVGLCGNLSVGMEMLQWAKDGYDPVQFPASNRDPNEGCSLIRVTDPKEGVYKYESSPYPFVYKGYCAFGSGVEGALVALSLGNNAATVVDAVCKHNTECGMGIDTLTLENI